MISETLTKLLDNIKFNETLAASCVNIDAGVWISAQGKYGIEGLDEYDVAELREQAETQLKKKIAAFLYGGVILELLKIHQGLKDPKPSKVADSVWVSLAIEAMLNEMGVSVSTEVVPKHSVSGGGA